MGWQALPHARPKWTHTRLNRGILGSGKGINTSRVVTPEISQGVRLQITLPPSVGSSFQLQRSGRGGGVGSPSRLTDVSDLSKNVHQALNHPLSWTTGLAGSASKVPEPL